MADVKTSALTAASSVDPADLLMAVDVSDTTMAASGTNKKATREQLQTYAAGTLTTDKKVLDLSATWNAAGVTFTGVKLNVTDTASAAASLLLDIQKGSASQFVIDKDGDVGIGTSSPGYKLDVESNPIRVAAASSGAGYIQYGKSATAANNWHLGSEGDGNFRLWNGNYGAGSLRMSIDSSGNVGIGTSSPGAKFEVYAASNPELRVNDGTVNFQLYAGTGTSNAVMGTVGAHALVMRTNATERMRIDSSGNVIVNTAAVATSATAGFLWIPSCAGAPTGAPTAPYTNAAALVADTTNNRLYVLVAGTWKYASLT